MKEYERNKSYKHGTIDTTRKISMEQGNTGNANTDSQSLRNGRSDVEMIRYRINTEVEQLFKNVLGP